MDPFPSALCPARQWRSILHKFPSPLRSLGKQPHLVTSENMLPAAGKRCSLLGSLIHLYGHAVGILLAVPCSLTALYCLTDFTTDCLIALRKGVFFSPPFLGSLVWRVQQWGKARQLSFLCATELCFSE